MSSQMKKFNERGEFSMKTSSTTYDERPGGCLKAPYLARLVEFSLNAHAPLRLILLADFTQALKCVTDKELIKVPQNI